MIEYLGPPGLFQAPFGGRNRGPRLTRAGDTGDGQPGGVKLQPLPGHRGHVEDIGGSPHHGRGLEFLNFEHPGGGVQHSPRHHLTTYLFGGVVPGPEGHEDIVAKGDEHPVGGAVALGPEDVAPSLGPPFPILPAVGLVHRGTGGARGLAELRHLLQGDAESAAIGEGSLVLGLLQLGLVGGGHPADVGHGLDVARFQAGLGVQTAVVGRVFICPGSYAFELTQLYFPEALQGQGLQVGIPISAFSSHRAILPGLAMVGVHPRYSKAPSNLPLVSWRPGGRCTSSAGPWSRSRAKDHGSHPQIGRSAGSSRQGEGRDGHEQGRGFGPVAQAG